MWYPCEKKKIHNLEMGKHSKIINGINELEVPLEQINLVTKNGEIIDVNSTMNDGDKIEIVPIVAGG